MPTYTYYCNECNKEFDKFQNINDEPLKICPNCNCDNLQKLISSPAFILKGHGWSRNGYSNIDNDKKSTFNSDEI